jgi:hypothetical protein
MENENNLILQNQKYSSMIRPTMGTSIIAPYLLDVVQKLGKYQLIYDYQVYNPFQILPQNTMLGRSLINPSPMVKEGGSNVLESANREQAFALAMENYRNDITVKPYTGAINQLKFITSDNPQLGTFAKGNVVNVIRFEGNTAVIENPNYVVPNANAPKVSSWASLTSDLINQKEFKIPKEYLSKVDDTTPVTVKTGINFGANPKVDYTMSIPKPYEQIDSPIKPRIIPELDNEVVLEQNASFVLSKDFKYILGYGSSIYNSKSGIGTADMSPKYATLKSGTKVTGRLIRKNDNTAYKLAYGTKTPPRYNDFLDVKGYGDKGRIEIPIEYLNKEVENMISTDTRTPVSVIALVDKKRGKCNTNGALIQDMQYDPCRVSAIKGQTYNGYISGGSFYGNDGNAYLPINEYQIVQQNSGTIVPLKNNNKNLLMIIGAFLAGYIVFGNSKSSN